MGLDAEEVDKRVHEAAEFVGLNEALLERSPFELSGGQKRRVAVAGVMAMKPRILVLDEPAAGLDPEGRDEILSEVKDYHKKTGTTVLLVSHSMEDIAKYADKVLVMSGRRSPCTTRWRRSLPGLRAAGTGPERAAGDQDLPQAAGNGRGCACRRLHHPLRRQDDPGGQARRDAGETLVLPRADKQKGGADKC